MDHSAPLFAVIASRGGRPCSKHQAQLPAFRIVQDAVRGIEAVSRALESEAPSFCGCPARLAPESLQVLSDAAADRVVSAASTALAAVAGRLDSVQQDADALAEALVRREADDAAEAEAIEAKAAQVAALVEMVARETADQAEMVTVIGDLAKETEEHSDAANAHLLVAAGTGPLFGRSIMIFLLALSGVLLMLHWLNP
ncbi:hypothetical protein FNF28_02124 [Cafeteria roenbergensis]|uniref:Uncharacterized protein n=1 Tax=Cafeteria roenbergensis TaxID=33653 RepID=A0A5A8DV63_CAFRO|nr:hypothetical protein FNF28_02124 [Cafeteria roenbergensis]